jgi:hypothetical protein
MSTPKLSTAIRSRIERRDRQAQTAFPAKVTAWKSSDNTVELEPQFIETWVNRDGTRQSEEHTPGAGNGRSHSQSKLTALDSSSAPSTA